jgi:hypothetical protein
VKNATSHSSLETLTDAQLVTATGGASCDDLRGITGRFRWENPEEMQEAQRCLADGQPRVKLIR